MELLQFFFTVQFWSGIIIGATFGMLGGLLLGLIVIPPIANDIMGLDDRTEPYPIWHPSKPTALSTTGTTAPPGGRDVAVAPAGSARAKERDWKPGGRLPDTAPAPAKRETEVHGNYPSPTPAPEETGRQ